MNLATIKAISDWLISLNNSLGDWIYGFYFQNSRLILDVVHTIFKGAFNVMIGATIVLAFIYLLVSIFALRRKSDTHTLKRVPSVTVQIPTFNELAALNCARRCVESDYPKDRLQIIIGDDSNKRSVSSRIDAFAAGVNKVHPGLVLITRRGNNAGFKPGNLNHMLKYSKGEFIVIFDSDFLPEKDFISRIIAPLTEDDSLAGVQARWKIVNFNQNIISILGGSISSLCHHVVLAFMKSIKSTAVLCGSAEAVRKKDLVRLGGWVSGSLTEDIEYALRLISHKKKILYLEGLECECEVPHTFKDLCKQQMRWAFGVITALKLHLGNILVSRSVKFRDKASIVLFASGYLFSILLFLITVFGFLSLASDRPAPIDWPRFFSETAVNILLTSGFLLATVVAMMLSRNGRKIPEMVASSLSVGLAVTYFVNVGIFKAMFGRKMQWFMLKKNGNGISYMQKQRST
jgi:cellulose synthase/poly-beta-1,6-N-acetylglucosamine synthase-like glycosyltransferase